MQSGTSSTQWRRERVHMATAKKTAAKKKPKPGAKAAASKPKASASKLVSSKDLAGQLGVQLTRRLDTPAVRKLRKALPGYVNMLDDVAALLEDDADLLNLRDVQPAALLDVQARQKYLAAREGVAEAVYRSIYEQRLQADDEAMGMLLKVARRVDAVSEDDPDILVRWKSLLDFLAKFRRGPSAAPPAEEPATGE